MQDAHTKCAELHTWGEKEDNVRCFMRHFCCAANCRNFCCRLTDWSLAQGRSAESPALCAGILRGPSAVLVRLFLLRLSAAHTDIVSPTMQQYPTVIRD